jgi:hypothetical protein
MPPSPSHADERATHCSLSSAVRHPGALEGDGLDPLGSFVREQLSSICSRLAWHRLASACHNSAARFDTLCWHPIV